MKWLFDEEDEEPTDGMGNEIDQEMMGDVEPEEPEESEKPEEPEKPEESEA